MAHGMQPFRTAGIQCIIPHGTGAGPTEEGVCYWLTRLKRHIEATLENQPPRVLGQLVTAPNAESGATCSRLRVETALSFCRIPIRQRGPNQRFER